MTNRFTLRGLFLVLTLLCVIAAASRYYGDVCKSIMNVTSWNMWYDLRPLRR